MNDTGVYTIEYDDNYSSNDFVYIFQTNYLDIFNKVSPFSTWNVVRGFSLPLIFWIFTKVFGSSALGVNIGMYLFYLFLIIFSYHIINIIFFKEV